MKNSPKTSSLKLKKRWFVLTHNSLDYYKSSEKNALKLGTLVLNSLCSVVPPDEKIFKETGNQAVDWNLTVLGLGGQISRLGRAPGGGVGFLSAVCTFFPPKRNFALELPLRLAVVSCSSMSYLSHSEQVWIYRGTERL